MMATPQAAKKIIATALRERGLNCKLTARTVSFSGFGYDDCIFVQVHGWPGGESNWNALRAAAQANGFYVEAA